MDDRKKIGIVVMFKMSGGGGGAPRAVVDLIKALDSMNYAVQFMTPWKLDFEKIEEIYESIDIDREYNLSESKSKFCIEPNLSRKLMKNEFIEMASNVDAIIDIDGGIVHDYLPENKKYMIWRLTGIESKKSKWEKSEWEKKSWKMILKSSIKKMITPNLNTLSKIHKIYAVDDWTRKRLINDWNLSPGEIILYPEIKTNEFSINVDKKKNQVIIFGRISPNKRIDESIRVFARGVRDNDYKLIIFGGITPDSGNYIRFLMNIAKEEGVEDRVEFVGNPSFEKLKEIVEESKILIECQRDISLTMTSIECLAAGVIVLVHKNGGTYVEVLDNGKYGIGLESIEEGGEKLKKIIWELEQSLQQLNTL